MIAGEKVTHRRSTGTWLSFIAGSIVKGAYILAVTSFIGMMTINFGNVILRYILGYPMYWGDEVMIYLMVIMVYAGFGIVLLEDGHIRVTLLFDRLPVKVQNVLWIILSFFGAAYTSYLLYAVIILILQSIRIEAFSQVTRWPLAPWQIAIACSLFAFIIAFIQLIITRIHIARGIGQEKKDEVTVQVKD